MVWRSGLQALGNSLLDGEDARTTIQNTLVGLTSGLMAHYVNNKFDVKLPNGILGGKSLLNSVVSEGVKSVFSNFSANFTSKF